LGLTFIEKQKKFNDIESLRSEETLFRKTQVVKWLFED
jgi:hypothetical protein